MTGFGEARAVVAGHHLTAELRSVNNRHFKLTYRAPEILGRFEIDLERVLRETISRGTVTLTIRVDRTQESAAPQLNQGVLRAYWAQLQATAASNGVMTPENLALLLTLPGIVDDGAWTGFDPSAAAADLEALVRATLDHYQTFRVQEGAAMGADLERQLATIETEVERIAVLAPQVIAEHRERLQQRMQEALQKAGVSVGPIDLLREVALFTDRADISEELVRLRSHIDQFRQLLRAQTSQGRKLEFLCQEFFREANTIGSKANHVGVAHAAVEIKTAIERMREVVQNLE